MADFAWFVVERRGLVAGGPSHEGIAERRDLISMWVHPELRGHGVAGELVAAVRGWAVAEGARELALWVADGNTRAARAYARAGFTASGERQPLPSNPAVQEERWLLPLDR